MIQKSLIIALTCLLFVLSGCSSISLTEVSRQYYEGNAIKAYEMTQSGANVAKKGDISGDELLWQIQGGVIGFDLGDEKAQNLLEKAEENINRNELSGVISGFFENLGAVLVNDTVIPYRGFLYEGAMVNYYKALFYMSQQNYADARVEFNRASDRQRRIKDYYQKEITKAQEAKSKIKSGDIKGDQEQQEREANKILQSYSNLSQFSAFNGYINPMIDYVSGVFFMLEGDYNKAQDFLKEAYGVSQAEVIKQDWEMAQNGGSDKKHTWVIIEDGKSPVKIERRFDLPIFTGDTLLHVGLALPDLKQGIEFASLYVFSNGTQTTQANKISTLNPLIYNEFAKQLPFIITRGVISTTTKTITQYVAQQAVKQAGGVVNLLVGIGTMTYGIATTRADLRIPTTFPNGFYALRIENVQGNFELKANNRIIATISMQSNCNQLGQICANKNNIVYVRNAGKNIFTKILFSK